MTMAGVRVEPSTRTTTATLPRVSEALRNDPAYQGYWVLRIGFTVAPILFGIDKFTNLLVDWSQYLAPWIANTVPLEAATVMQLVGIVEIVAGLVVAFAPRYGGYLVAAWLGGIIVNLLTYPGYYDIALRDFGLLLAAIALARFAAKFDRGEPFERAGRF